MPRYVFCYDSSGVAFCIFCKKQAKVYFSNPKNGNITLKTPGKQGRKGGGGLASLAVWLGTSVVKMLAYTHKLQENVNTTVYFPNFLLFLMRLLLLRASFQYVMFNLKIQNLKIVRHLSHRGYEQNACFIQGLWY